MCKDYKLIVHEAAKSPIAEAFRILRTNLQFSQAGKALKTMMFTSTGPGEGKSTIAANTAVALAQSGKQVLVIDCDLRKPVQHSIFKVKNRGLTNCLIEETSPDELFQETGVPNLKVLTSGPIPPNPSELLGSAQMLELITVFKERFDYLVFDAPPVVAVTDACVLASWVEGVILVISTGMVRPDMVQYAKDLVIRAQGRILGVILNKVKIQDDYSYYYYYQNDGGVKRRSPFASFAK